MTGIVQDCISIHTLNHVLPLNQKCVPAFFLIKAGKIKVKKGKAIPVTGREGP
jgi:hypothetical protein